MNSPRKVKSLISLSQIIQHERDSSSPCVKYPYKNFNTFGECDQSFIYKEMLNRYGLVPFWTSRTLNKVTKLRFNYCSQPQVSCINFLMFRFLDNFYEMGVVADLFDGIQASDCLRPCLSTQVNMQIQGQISNNFLPHPYFS